MLRVVLLIVLFSIPAALIELLVCLFTRMRLFKYILPVISFVLSVVLFVYASTLDHEGFRDLGYILLGAIALFICVITLFLGAVFDIIKTSKVKKAGKLQTDEK